MEISDANLPRQEQKLGCQVSLSGINKNNYSLYQNYLKRFKKRPLAPICMFFLVLYSNMKLHSCCF